MLAIFHPWCLVLDELALSCLHAVCENKAQIVPRCNPLEAHDHLGYHTPFLIVAQIRATQVLAKSVHNDQSEIWQLLDDLF